MLLSILSIAGTALVCYVGPPSLSVSVRSACSRSHIPLHIQSSLESQIPKLSSPQIYETLVDIYSQLLILSIYRLTLHPLAKYPGPFLARVSVLHAFYHAWKGDRHLESFQCHEKYGTVYRYSPNGLSFNTKTALQSIYGAKANCWKGTFYESFPARKDACSVHSELNKKNHAFKRRVLSHAFSDRALKAMDEYVLAQIRIFCAALGKEEVKDMAKWSDYLTFDVLGDLCFGKSFEMQMGEGNRFIADLIAKSSKQVLITGIMPIFKTWHLDRVLFPELPKTKVKFNQYCKAQATERSKAVMDRKDFFYYLLNANDSETGEGFTMPDLWAESSSLIVAGADTSSTTLAGTFFYLTHYPAVLEKLTREIRDTFAGMDIEAIKSGPLLSSCVYLRACIDETMRCSPPLPGLLPREVQPGGATIDGHVLPVGTIVGVASYSIHHNARYYPSPFQYRPGRWLVSSPAVHKEDVEAAQAAFCPFSLGPRGCIGMNMAYMELMTTVARVVFLFDMSLKSKLGEGSPRFAEGRRREEEYQVQDTFTSRKEGPMVQFVSREG